MNELPRGLTLDIDSTTHYHRDLTLRDYFAVNALHCVGRYRASNGPKLDPTDLAYLSYAVADAMLKARERQ